MATNNLTIKFRTIETPQYTLIKTMWGSKIYLPALLYLGKRRTLHRAFTRAGDAVGYRERVVKRIGIA